MQKRNTELVKKTPQTTNQPTKKNPNQNDHKTEATIGLLVLKSLKFPGSIIPQFVRLESSTKNLHLDSTYSCFYVCHQNLCGHILSCVSLTHYSMVSKSGVVLIHIKPTTLLIQTPKEDKHIQRHVRHHWNNGTAQPGLTTKSKPS